MDSMTTKYSLEIITHDVVFSAESLTPFPSFREGDIIDPGTWADNLQEDGKLQVTAVTYWIDHIGGHSGNGMPTANRVKVQLRCRILPR